MVAIDATICQGYGLASGQRQDVAGRGSIAWQASHFLQRGLNLSQYFSGTLNLEISPYIFTNKSPDYYFKQLRWHPSFPAEDFSFTRCHLVKNEQAFAAFVYYPHPETKIGHFHSSSVVEVIAPFIDGLCYGDSINLMLPQACLSFR
ncbi:hypothetical protein CW748_06315 [Alteromonadales bacterium alter-6D02]|nr:hypothetical protein CW748_06315 [Alteromonadales bacterium alter-6D02]